MGQINIQRGTQTKIDRRTNSGRSNIGDGLVIAHSILT